MTLYRNPLDFGITFSRQTVGVPALRGPLIYQSRILFEFQGALVYTGILWISGIIFSRRIFGVPALRGPLIYQSRILFGFQGALVYKFRLGSSSPKRDFEQVLTIFRVVVLKGWVYYSPQRNFEQFIKFMFCVTTN